VVAAQPGWRVEFERFGAGPTGVEVHGLEFAMPGVSARSAPIAVRIAPGALLNKRELRIERVEARRLRVTLTPAEMPASTAREPFAGVLRLLQSPLAWALDAAELEGEIAVREGGQTVVIGAFAINGGGLSANRPGEFTYSLDINSSLLPIGPENRIRSRGTVRLVQAAGHRVGRITIEGELHLPRYGTVALPPGTFTAEVSEAEGGETYSAKLGFGTESEFTFSGKLDAATARLEGRATAHVSAAFTASLIAAPLPDTRLDGHAQVAVDLRSGDIDATVESTLDLQHLSRLAPQLAGIDAARGRASAQLTRRSGRLSVTRAEASLREPRSEATLQLTLEGPVDPFALPAGRVATLSIRAVPLAWVNPWLAPADVVLAGPDFGSRWAVALADDRETLQLTPASRIELAALTLKGAKLPSLPPLTVSFTPRVTLSAAGASYDCDDLTLTTSPGDRILIGATAGYDFRSQELTTRGELTAFLPTLLAGPKEPLPINLSAKWDATLSSSRMQVNTLQVTTRSEETAAPSLDIALLRSLALDLSQFTAPRGNTDEHWLHITADQLPLDWIARWVPGYAVGGRIAAGRSVLQSAPDGRLTLVTPTPWQLRNATFGVGGKVFFTGDAQVTPEVAFHAQRVQAALRAISAVDRNGNRIRGDITAVASLQDRKASTAVAFDAELPALPHARETFGTLLASLQLKSHNESDKIAIVDEFDLRVRNAHGELARLNAPAPFVAGLSNSGLFTVGTVEPLQLTTGEIPLAWLRPWIPAVEAEGTLQPTEFALTAQLTKFLVRPIKPLHVRGFGARIAGRDIARQMEFAVYPGLDLTLICVPFPAFQLAYSGTAHLTNGSVDVAGVRAVDVDAALSFIGNDRQVLPSGIEYSTRADFAALARVPALAGRGLPARGSLVARVNGDMLGKAPLELWSRVEGVPDAKHTRVLPALEISATGKVSPDRTLAANIGLRLDTQPRVTDARFDAHLHLTAGKLEIASGFKSEFFDAGEALAVLEGLYSPTPAPAPVQTQPAPKPRSGSTAPPTYAQLGVPFWSHLRGHFDLDLGTVRYAPYQIDQVRGRLDLRERELVLSQLQGEMFAGRWSGGVRVDYDGSDAAADHRLTGEFRIAQFDSARVVQTVFPTELASVDAKIDVRSTVRSRGNALFELLDRTAGEFTVEGKQGIVRLNVPKQEMAATAAVFGGTVLLSPELRALGRLLKKFAEMPVDQLRISGARHETGEVQLTEFSIDSPQARLVARGTIPAAADEPLMNRPLQLSIDLAAKDEMAVILGGMKLIDPKPRADGYRPLKEPFELRGKAGEPDTRPLYDLLAKAVLGSKGTWGFLMRKVQEQVNKMKPASATQPNASTRAPVTP
jgi:hypothetical protein